MITEECLETQRLDPRVRRTRRLLEDALRELLGERAYSEISVGEIAERATVNRATFYAHYTDKQDLTNALLRRELREAITSRVRPDADFNERNLEVFTTVIFEWVARLMRDCPRHAGELVTSCGTSFQETIHEMIRAWLEVDVRAMRHFPNVPKGVAASVLAWSIYGSSLRWARKPQKISAEKAAAQVTAMLLR
ncbi:MAG: TetR/AcrR family transcriptional regulator [Fimbriimonadaceae bacterium]